MIESGELAVPPATVARLPHYLRALRALRALRDLQADGVRTTSSSELADASGVGSAQLRKDLSYLGSFGTRGVGYDVASLTTVIAGALGLEVTHRLAIVGLGNLGHALANYSGYSKRGFQVVALLDVAPGIVGTQAAGGLVVEHADDLEKVVERESVSMAVLATPGPVAQAIAERLVSAGVRDIPSFAPVALQLPEDAVVRSVDVAGELQILAFHAAARAAAASAANA